ncbi:hypothetical protein GCM10010358_45200 [Streptomyces minutiscleroticus]|uniref:Uncharacterized protein n=1 Tax=Streptomyces minutiscleroticus TaxID=68238 RepID=A0A918NPQ7_9ACTN|nr:hypothetical protein GCM10010358_45200 [Streptomyces minutiscleroticus]
MTGTEEAGAEPSPPVVSVCEGPSVRSGPSPVREGPSESREPEPEPTPPEMVGGWLRSLSMALRSSALLLTAPLVSEDSTWLLRPAPTKVDQLVDQSPSKAPLIRISASASPEPAARKSAVPLSP